MKVYTTRLDNVFRLEQSRRDMEGTTEFISWMEENISKDHYWGLDHGSTNGSEYITKSLDCKWICHIIIGNDLALMAFKLRWL